MGRGYLEGLLELGVDCAAVSPRGFLHDRGFELAAGIREIPPAEAKRLPPPEVGLGFLHPPFAGRLIGRRKAGLFVWESDLAPAAWVRELDRWLDIVVVPSEFTREALVRSGFPAAKAAVVPYGHDPLLPGAPRARRSGPFTLLSIVSPHRRKGIRELFLAYRAAFSAVDDVLLRVKTTYDPGQRRRRSGFEISSWADAISACRLAEPGAPRVRLEVGTVPDAAMPALYAEADVFVAPSWGESFGLALLDALAAGLPAIATGWGGHMSYFPEGPDALPFELVDAGSSLYEPAAGAKVAVPDVSVLAERMRWHHDHPEESRALGTGARERVACLTWRRAAGALLAVLPPRGM